jgi:hypothetical protein
MPQIIVTADQTDGREDGAVMLRERVTLADFESDHFTWQLVERLGWAVGDAHHAEQQPAEQHGEPRRDQARDSASVVTTAS